MPRLVTRCTLGQVMQEKANGQKEAIDRMTEDNLRWLEEVLLEAKKALATPDVELLPKTPACKRARRRLRGRRSSRMPSDDDDGQSPDGVSRASLVRATRATRSRRNADSGHVSCSAVRPTRAARPRRNADSGHVSGGATFDMPAVVSSDSNSDSILHDAGDGDVLAATTSAGDAASGGKMSTGDVAGHGTPPPASAGKTGASVDRPTVGDVPASSGGAGRATPFMSPLSSPVKRVELTGARAFSPARSPRAFSPAGSPRPAAGFRHLSVMQKVHALEAARGPTIHYGVASQPADSHDAPSRVSAQRRVSVQRRVSAQRRVSCRKSVNRSVMESASQVRRSVHRNKVIHTAPTPCVQGTAAAAVRCTRSKLRLNKAAPPPPASVTAADSPARHTRSKVRPAKPGSGERLTAGGAHGGKRPPHDQQSADVTPPKRQCTAPPSKMAGSSTVSPIIRSKPQLNHSRMTPTHQSNSSVLNSFTSFMRRNTPKSMSQKDIVEQRRKELAVKERQDEGRIHKRQELLQKRAEQQRLRREERQRLAELRRAEKERIDMEAKQSLALRVEEKQVQKTRALAERLREEQDRREQRERKAMEAEVKRRERSGVRQQKVAVLEEEQRRFEETMCRRREQDDQERQRRIAETKRTADSRLAELERDRLQAAERLRAAAEGRARDEQDRFRLKEERERQARADRDRQEVDRQREKERAKLDALARQREMVRLKLDERREQERQANEHKRMALQIGKHNHALQQNSSLNSSSNSSSMLQRSQLLFNKTTVAAAAAAAAAAVVKEAAGSQQPHRSQLLNTTATVRKAPASPISYALTPPVRRVKPRSSENYDIANANSGDSTDDNDAPRKPIPKWACGNALKAVIVTQCRNPPDVDAIFGSVSPPNLNAMFVKRKPRFNKRTSSAIWHSPILGHLGN